MNLVSYPIGKESFGSSIKKSLRKSHKGDLIRIAVANISFRGAKKVENDLKKFIGKYGTVEIIAGIDIGYDPLKGIKQITRICGPGSVFIFWDPSGYIFHPKIYCITDANMQRGEVWIGSSNFTENGLFNNYECGLQLSLEKGHNLLDQINRYFIRLRKNPCCQPATNDLIQLLLQSEKGKKKTRERHSPARFPLSIRQRFFHKSKKKKFASGFVMLLSRNDVSGKRFEPYFLIPVRARDENPEFWEWRDAFLPSPRSGMPQRPVETIININDKIINEKKRIYWVDERKEFRFVSPSIYRLGKKSAGSLLYLLKKGKGYNIRVISPKNVDFAALLNYAVNLSSSQKKWGYTN